MLYEQLWCSGVVVKFWSGNLRLETLQDPIHELSSLFYKELHDQAPEYITDLLYPRNCSRTLRFSNSMMLSVPRSHLKLKGDHAF